MSNFTAVENKLIPFSAKGFFLTLDKLMQAFKKQLKFNKMKNLITVLVFVFGFGLAGAQQVKPPKSTTQKTITNKAEKAQQLPKSVTQITPSAKFKKDGTPDRRYKVNRKLKKDGTPDKRYK